jgi:hypothetical protein
MFPPTQSRFRTALRRSLDAAIDFATLGDYGYAPAWEGPAADASADERAWLTEPVSWDFAVTAGASLSGDGAATAALLEPASAAGRARRNAERREAPACAGQPVRGRALASKLPRTSRTRDGMAPREQACSA